MIYENDLFECFLITNPRAAGHAIISTKEHYKDMLQLPDDLCREIFSFARRVMVALKEVFGAESVYLCTMCDGPMNHFHVQMIPRFSYEARGSRNFVKKRGEYVAEPEKVQLLRQMLSDI
jgi:diadenosine tetraphosphate (Ap4A) HIT family hydrolase